MHPRHDKNPYSGFKNDRERRLALHGRDVRLTVVGVAIAIAFSEDPQKFLGYLQILRSFVF